MAEASATPVIDQLPFGQSYWDYLPDMIQDYTLDLAADMAAKSLHQDRMKKLCISIREHYDWDNLISFPYDLPGQECLLCKETLSPECDMRRHRGLCKLNDLLDSSDDDDDDDFVEDFDNFDDSEEEFDNYDDFDDYTFVLNF